jgi:phosphopantothenoylcysteine decarboxylase
LIVFGIEVVVLMASSQSGSSGGRLLVGASGSAAVAFLPAYISALRAGFSGTVSVLMTHTATQFLPQHTVGLFADRVITAESPSTWPADNHATLAAEHDLLAVFPATANTLSAVAAGAAPNMLCATVLATTCPVVFFPVMTAEMWGKQAVRRNVSQLREDGYHVVDPAVGSRYDVGLARVVEGPVPPPAPMFAEVIREYMPERCRAGSAD